MPTYPSGIVSLTNPTSTDTMDSVSVPHDVQHSLVNDEIEAIEAELGINPSGGFSTVTDRLNAIDTTAWTEWTPTILSGSMDFGDGKIIGRYKQIGKTVFGNIVARWGTGGSGGSGFYLFSLPVAPNLSLITDHSATSVPIGSSTLVRAGSYATGDHAIAKVHAYSPSGTPALLTVLDPAISAAAYYIMAHDNPWAWGNVADVIFMDFTYEAA